MNNRAKDILKRYGIATLGLILIAVGVALSLKSNLGTAPVSCPPAVLNLRWGFLSVGTLTWMMHLVFILTQMILRRKVLDSHYLLQLAAAFVFGYLCDAAIWLCQGIPVGNYAVRLLLTFAAILLTVCLAKLASRQIPTSSGLLQPLPAIKIGLPYGRPPVKTPFGHKTAGILWPGSPSCPVGPVRRHAMADPLMIGAGRDADNGL